jgi:hypothetical protein
MAQVVGRPEFKPQYCQKIGNRKKGNKGGNACCMNVTKFATKKILNISPARIKRLCWINT